MTELCLMAYHGYPPGSGLVFHQEQNRVIKPYFPGQGATQEITRSNSLSLRPHHHEEPCEHMNGFCKSNQLAKIGSTVRRPVLIDVQDARQDSVHFSFGIAEQCTRHEKILQFLMSGSSDLEASGVDLSLLSKLVGIEALKTDVHHQLCASLIYPGSEFHDSKPLVDFVGDMVHSSKITIHSDGQVLFTGSGTEMKDILSIVAEFYLSKNSTKWRKQPMLVPQFGRLYTSEVQVNCLESSLMVNNVAAAPLKSPEKVKLKPPPKKKNNKKKASRERDLYKRNYFHACETLLSLMMDKKWRGKTTILSLKKSGPELPELLTQFSAGIAGTGLAVLFTIGCRVACGRVPFCASKLFSTGFGIGLVWLSGAVNNLRDTIVYVSKSTRKLSLKDEEMVRSVDKSMKEIYFRAATVIAVAVLRLA